MSTRAMLHFNQSGKTYAKVYRRGDGYPTGLGKDIIAFIDEIDKNLKDKRFGDPSYLAARWVVWDARNVIRMYERLFPDKKRHPLDLLSVGVMQEDAGDAEFIYDIECDSQFGVDVSVTGWGLDKVGINEAIKIDKNDAWKERRA